MIGIQLTTATILLPLLFLLSTLYINQVDACGGKKLAIEKCTTNDDCLGYNDEIPESICGGRNSSDVFVTCPDVDVDLCICVPLIARLKGCSKHNQCPDEQYCGISPRTMTSVCVGCLALGDKDINFSPVFKVPQDRCTSDEHPPCGSVNDFCSPTMQCNEEKECVGFVGGELFQCIPSLTPCTCSLPIPSGSRSIATESCSVNEDCTDPREACVFSTVLLQNYCSSCDSVRLDKFLLLNDTTKCDKLETERRAPNHYTLSPNGLTYDTCVVSDSQCVGDRKCVEFTNENRTDIKPCTAVDELCFCREKKLKSCKTGTDCTNGESCAVSEPLSVNNHCVSNSLFDQLSTNNYKITGKFTPTKDGTKLTNQKCRFDWNCKRPRRCTHAFESYGGCAGRDGCLCKPLTEPSCGSNADCETKGESCVKYVGGRSRPFCSSTKEMKQGNFTTYIPVESTDPVPTPIPSPNGLNEDRCLTKSDCKGDRQCLHANENAGLCDGRPNCKCLGKTPNCVTNGECDDGETCSMFSGSFPESFRCISSVVFMDNSIYVETTVSPSPSMSLSTTPSASPSEGVENLPEPSVEPVDIEDVSGSPSPQTSSMPQNTENTENTDAEPSPEPVCIDVKLLKDVPAEDLVFKTPRRGAVLCDKLGTCATPGHMVVFNGVGVSMKNYCKNFVKNGCEKRVTLVNSPRMKYGLRISSLTNNLHMTAHAARYESWIEEAFLSRIINHLGF